MATSPPVYHQGQGGGAPPPLLQSPPQQQQDLPPTGPDSHQQQGVGGGYGNAPGTEGGGEFTSASQGQHKRLHISNIPFKFREPDLRQLFMVRMV